MKIIFKHTNESSSKYNRKTSGWEFIDTVDTQEEFYSKVQSLEDNDLFPHEDFDTNGILLTASGNEAFEPDYPNRFEFGDYTYYLKDVESIDPFYEDGKIQAIKADHPYNLHEIIELIGGGEKQ